MAAGILTFKLSIDRLNLTFELSGSRICKKCTLILIRYHLRSILLSLLSVTGQPACLRRATLSSHKTPTRIYTSISKETDMKPLSRQLENYIRNATSEAVLALCEPLSKLQLSYFLYVQEDNMGNRSFLTNAAKWTANYFQQEYYQSSAFENYEFHDGHHLWCTLENGTSVFNYAANEFDITHGITFIKKQSAMTKYFHYAAPEKNNEIYDIYLNKTGLLERFNLYFTEAGSKVISDISRQKHGVSFKKIKERSVAANDDSIGYHDYLSAINSNKVYVPDLQKVIHLTAREKECAYWLVRGKSISEISMILNISGRTVESHINHIKKRFDCYKQCRLGYLLGKTLGW